MCSHRTSGNVQHERPGAGCGRGVKSTGCGVQRVAASSSCVGRRDVPGPSTDCSVTDGLRWIADKNSVHPADQPKRIRSHAAGRPPRPGRHRRRAARHHLQAGDEVQARVVRDRLPQGDRRTPGPLRHRRRSPPGPDRTHAPTDAIMAATAVAPRRNARTATGSPAAAAAANSLAVAAGVASQPFSRAHCTRCGPLAMASAQPRPPQVHCGPAVSTTTCPTWPALPVRPTCRGTVENEAAADSGGHHQTRTNAAPAPPPRQCSPRRHAHAVAAQPHGSPGSTPATRSRIGNSRHAVRLIGLTVPVGRCTGPADAMPAPPTSYRPWSPRSGVR